MYCQDALTKWCEPIKGYRTIANKWSAVMIVHKIDNIWRVTDVITGMMVTDGHTRAQALDKLKNIQEAYTQEQYHEHVRRALKLQGKE